MDCQVTASLTCSSTVGTECMLMLQKVELNKSEIAEALHYYCISSQEQYTQMTLLRLQSGLPRETPWEVKVPDEA